MAIIRIPEHIWHSVHHHLFDEPGEHFAFLLAKWTSANGIPVFMVYDALCIPDHLLVQGRYSAELKLEGVVSVINVAVKNGDCLIEAHNHGGEKPRFSVTDRVGLEEFPPYILDSLPGRPYAATVWGDTSIYGEFFLPDGKTGVVKSITVVGAQLRQLVSRDDDGIPAEATYNRQLPWFTDVDQQKFGRLAVALVGCGGIGSQIAQNLAYLGCKNFILIDDDSSDETSFNRLVTAKATDLGIAKVTLAEHYIRSVAPQAQILTLSCSLRSAKALDVLKGVDVIFGAVDNDAARLILNEIAKAYSILYLDAASGITAKDGIATEIGGRVAVVLPDRPCLNCIGEIDPDEASYFLASENDRVERVTRGYVKGMDVISPAVISLNAQVAASAVNEFIVYVTGVRQVNVFTEYDLLGVGRLVKGQWLTPRRIRANPNCVSCGVAGLGDGVDLERYIMR